MLQTPRKRRAFPKTLLLTPSTGGNPHGTGLSFSLSSPTCLGQEDIGEHGFKQGFNSKQQGFADVLAGGVSLSLGPQTSLNPA